MSEPLKVLLVFDGCLSAEDYAHRILIGAQTAINNTDHLTWHDVRKALRSELE